MSGCWYEYNSFWDNDEDISKIEKTQDDDKKNQRVDKILTIASDTQRFVLVGVPGSGKTTTTGKLANYLKTRKKKVLVAACDLQRLAAVEQLKQIAAQIEVDIYFDDIEKDPIKIAKGAVEKAKKEFYDVVLIMVLLIS